MTPDGAPHQTEPASLRPQHPSPGRTTTGPAPPSEGERHTPPCGLTDQDARVAGLLADVEAAIRTGSPEIGAAAQSRAALRTPADSEAITQFDQALGAVSRAVVGAEADAGTIARILSLTARRLVRTLIDDLRADSVTYVEALIDAVHAENMAERTRIARELHDHIGNSISGAYRRLELLEIYRESDPAKASLSADCAREDLRGILERLQSLLSGLRLSETEHGLERALTDYLGTVQEQDAVASLEINGDENWLDNNTREQLFLVLREAARNAFRHADPAHLSITVCISAHEVRATVRDDGVGFDPTPRPRNSSGLASMRERIELLGGTLNTDSAPGRGTRVEVLVPLRHRP